MALLGCATAASLSCVAYLNSSNCSSSPATTCISSSTQTNRHLLGCCWSVGSEERKDKKQTSLLQAATYAAVLRSKESMMPEPLFHDPYAACVATLDLINNNDIVSMARKYHGLCFELKTKFIDDKLVKLLENNEVRQIVMFTDGMDTRAYRLAWPFATTIFDLSPGQVHDLSRERLKAAGAKVSRGCFLQHIPLMLSKEGCLEDEGWTRMLESLGYRGDKPSIWVMQGIYVSFQSLQLILECASYLAMKDAIFIGEVAIEDSIAPSKKEAEEVFTKLCLSNGFKVLMFHQEDTRKSTDETEVTLDFGRTSSSSWFPFVARQQKFSEQQLEYVRREIEFAEDAGEEEGFEDW